MPDERFLITGAMGCIGAWTVAALVRESVPVVTFDLSDSTDRWRLVMSDEEVARVVRVRGDLTDSAHVDRVVAEHGITHVVHLAAIQFPFSKADPSLGARVNVVGTTNVFVACAGRRDHVRGLSYASSVAVFGPMENYPNRTVADDSPLDPRSFYGVYKQANELAAGVFEADRGLGSIGLRPPIVYGLGRDQGITADPSLAMRAVANGKGFHIAFGGRVALSYAGDVAKDFVSAARAESPTARVHNVRGRTVAVGQIVDAIDAVSGRPGLVTHGDARAETVERVDDTPVDELLTVKQLVNLEDGVRQTIEGYAKQR
jgi:nucleoside-diphosphate-sugar epimerase